MKTLPPGSTIGILGGGQLGRMTALAAAQLGYNCHIFCTDKNEPAVAVSAAHTIGSFTDKAALEKFASQVDVVTLEWENVPLQALEILADRVPVHPGLNVLKIAQDREQEKTFARSVGVGTADFAIVHSAAELEKEMVKFQLPAILKSTRMGYDGKGQVKITPGMKAADAWKEMGGTVGILEAFVDFACEISVIVACRADGAMAAFPAVQNIHRNAILAETHAPAAIDPAIAKEAEHIARKMAEKIGLVGLLAVEMFVLREPNKHGQRVLMNEIAPRPHNSGHWTMDACACSQFEQLVRAVCGLPLASISPHSRAVMHNLIGDDVERWPQLLQDPSACLHLYGKTETRPGRKMGHVTFLKGAW
ncbi:MAG TPA: 5-(carboxyamino)imidazole ribonucleotide synthase [Alphaproteobacteria bacterium]|nr:5-(carboxyamino)imidazole ribonucleotide synthase [Alphaproteobacteria bacterium]